MIQRIQTFWLLLAAACMVLTLTMPVVIYFGELPIVGQEVSVQVNIYGEQQSNITGQILDGDFSSLFKYSLTGAQQIVSLVLIILTILVSLVDIFLYKNRATQLKVLALAFLFDAIYVVLAFVWLFDSNSKGVMQLLHIDVHTMLGMGTIAAIVALVFLVLAQRGIRKDQNKVKAADRLR